MDSIEWGLFFLDAKDDWGRYMAKFADSEVSSNKSDDPETPIDWEKLKVPDVGESCEALTS